MICDWSDVREGTLDMPTCIKGICGGHNAKDLLPFQIKVDLFPLVCLFAEGVSTHDITALCGNPAGIKCTRGCSSPRQCSWIMSPLHYY